MLSTPYHIVDSSEKGNSSKEHRAPISVEEHKLLVYYHYMIKASHHSQSCCARMIEERKVDEDQ